MHHRCVKGCSARAVQSRWGYAMEVHHEIMLVIDSACCLDATITYVDSAVRHIYTAWLYVYIIYSCHACMRVTSYLAQLGIAVLERMTSCGASGCPFGRLLSSVSAAAYMSMEVLNSMISLFSIFVFQICIVSDGLIKIRTVQARVHYYCCKTSRIAAR